MDRDVEKKVKKRIWASRLPFLCKLFFLSLACIVALSVVCFLFGEQREIAINNQFSDSSSAAIDIGSRFDDEFKSDFQTMDALDFVEDVVEHHVEIEDF